MLATLRKWNVLLHPECIDLSFDLTGSLIRGLTPPIEHLHQVDQKKCSCRQKQTIPWSWVGGETLLKEQPEKQKITCHLQLIAQTTLIRKLQPLLNIDPVGLF